MAWPFCDNDHEADLKKIEDLQKELERLRWYQKSYGSLGDAMLRRSENEAKIQTKLDSVQGQYDLLCKRYKELYELKANCVHINNPKNLSCQNYYAAAEALMQANNLELGRLRDALSAKRCSDSPKSTGELGIFNKQAQEALASRDQEIIALKRYNQELSFEVQRVKDNRDLVINQMDRQTASKDNQLAELKKSFELQKLYDGDDKNNIKQSATIKCLNNEIANLKARLEARPIKECRCGGHYHAKPSEQTKAEWRKLRADYRNLRWYKMSDCNPFINTRVLVYHQKSQSAEPKMYLGTIEFEGTNKIFKSDKDKCLELKHITHWLYAPYVPNDNQFNG